MCERKRRIAQKLDEETDMRQADDTIKVVSKEVGFQPLQQIYTSAKTNLACGAGYLQQHC